MPREVAVRSQLPGRNSQYDLPVTWLIVDDGGYGILRAYMTDAFGETTAAATEPTRPDVVAPAESFGVPAVRTAQERLTADLAAALVAPGPSAVVLPAVVLPARLRMFAATQLVDGTSARCVEGPARSGRRTPGHPRGLPLGTCPGASHVP
ncbi:hypothetical protein GCM10010211_63770 [Streptomyces albospinus]|uniref:Thiamine pyrophosphate enzyme TPP-binding domain-containing protein n=1 Tax=Streptomyces albospinus TaxID=285515 RepID=A0ABQ2VIL8_9ACTN|nr:hypothetical protein GCM10010211_63770 [Streptomyces albospinus]